MKQKQSKKYIIMNTYSTVLNAKLWNHRMQSTPE